MTDSERLDWLNASPSMLICDVHGPQPMWSARTGSSHDGKWTWGQPTHSLRDAIDEAYRHSVAGAA